MIYQKEREEVAAIMRRLYKQGLTTCSGGNISLRVSSRHILITPSALDKGNINFRQIALMSIEGENLTPALKPSIETGMHLAVLQARPEIKAVVHAHPTHASYLTACGEKRIRTDFLAEARFLLDEPAFAPYALMGTEGLAENTAAALGRNKTAVLLENHGVLTVGTDLLKAFDRMEVLEAAATMTLFSKLNGAVSPLSETRLKEIDRMNS